MLLIGCTPQNKTIVGVLKSGDTPSTPKVNLLVANQKEITIRGKYLDEIVRVKFKGDNGYEKSFKIKSRAFEKLVLNAVDMLSIPVGVGLEMVLSSAWADNSFPIIFSLQPNAVAAENIQNGAATRLKLNKEPGDIPNDGDILVWKSGSNTFEFEPKDGGSGGGGPAPVSPIKICRIEYRLDVERIDSIVPFIADVGWDSGGPYGLDCAWLTYGTATEASYYFSDSYIKEFTLPPGTYLIDVWTAFQKCDSSWIDIYNVTKNRREIQGSTHYGRFNIDVDTTYIAKTTVNLTEATTFKIRSYASSERCTTSDAEVENSYELNGQVIIWKFN